MKRKKKKKNLMTTLDSNINNTQISYVFFTMFFSQDNWTWQHADPEGRLILANTLHSRTHNMQITCNTQRSIQGKRIKIIDQVKRINKWNQNAK